MGKATGRVTLTFDELQVDASTEDEAHDEVMEMVAASLPFSSIEVDSIHIDEFSSIKVAEVTISASMTFTISYDPDVQDLQTIIEDNAPELLLERGDADVEVSIDDEDTGLNPDLADYEGENF